MTRKERMLVVLISAGITALVLLGIWSLRSPEPPRPPILQPRIDPPVAWEDGQERPLEGLERPPVKEMPREKIEIAPETPDGGAIEGRVVDEGGSPISKVEITAMQRRTPVRYAFTSADGTYSIAYLAPGVYDMRAQREGYAEAGRRGIRVERLKTSPDVDFELVRGSSFSGSVVDSGKEEPIPGARVTLYVSGPAVDPRGLVRTFHTSTDASGEFSIGDVPPGEYFAVAQHTAYLSAERITLTVAREAPAAYKFVLELGGSVEGRVTDAEENPVADSQVWLSEADNTLRLGKGARTGADGRYVLGGLEPATVNIRVVADGFVTATRENIEVHKGRATEGVDFRLDRGNTVSGVVVNRSGEPVKNATVSGSDTVNYKNTRTGQDGTFMLGGFSGEKINLSVRARGHVFFVRRGIPANTEDLRLVLSEGGAVEGRVISDVPFKQFSVRLYSHLTDGKKSKLVKQKVISNPEGFFLVEDIPEGLYTLRAEGWTLEEHPRTYIEIEPETVDVREGSTVGGLRVSMQPKQK